MHFVILLDKLLDVIGIISILFAMGCVSVVYQVQWLLHIYVGNFLLGVSLVSTLPIV